MRKAGAIGFMMLLAACTPDPPSTAAADAQAKQFEVPPGMGAIYVLRGPDHYRVDGLPVSVSGQNVSRLGVRTYVRADVAPGQHRIICGENEAPFYVNVSPGRIAYVDAVPLEGVLGLRCMMSALDDLNGRERVLAGQRVAPRGG